MLSASSKRVGMEVQRDWSGGGVAACEGDLQTKWMCVCQRSEGEQCQCQCEHDYCDVIHAWYVMYVSQQCYIIKKEITTTTPHTSSSHHIICRVYVHHVICLLWCLTLKCAICTIVYYVMYVMYASIIRKLPTPSPQCFHHIVIGMWSYHIISLWHIIWFCCMFLLLLLLLLLLGVSLTHSDRHSTLRCCVLHL